MQRGTLLVACQLAAIAVLLTQATRALWQPLPLAGLAAAFLLLGWAVWAMGVRRVRVQPEPGAHGVLCRRGPYRWVRHPMYSAVLLGTLVIVLTNPAWIAAGAWAALVGVLLAKARYEERLLTESIPEYAAYRAETKRLVPFVV